MLDQAKSENPNEQLTNGNHVDEDQDGNIDGGGKICLQLSRGAVEQGSNSSCLILGLFQITVKLPHDPYKIQVMVNENLFYSSLTMRLSC